MATIAFLGLGNMGGPMAKNLLAAGHALTVFDLVEMVQQRPRTVVGHTTADHCAGGSAAGRAGEHGEKWVNRGETDRQPPSQPWLALGPLWKVVRHCGTRVRPLHSKRRADVCVGCVGCRRNRHDRAWSIPW